jgi:cyclopropane-fatty-acyl-phospholipid synthase
MLGRMDAEKFVRNLASTFGVEINGQRPWDIQVHDARFYRRVLADGSLGLGESYMAGWWDCNDLGDFFYRLFLAGVDARDPARFRLRLMGLMARLRNLQSRQRAPHVAEAHYNKTIAAYRNMSDKWITLSCGYWKDARDLDEAQDRKLDLVCRKIGLARGERVLDIGCGFGSFARFAAERYGCAVTGINLSSEQIRVARELARGLPVEIVQCDYRETHRYRGDRPFDKIVSIGMFEHVGYKNIRPYMEAAHHCLADGGLFLLHTIGSNVSQHYNDPWYDKYIFPNGMLPSIQQIAAAIEGLFVMEDWHNFGPDYARTHQAWYERFDRSWEGPKSDPFYRMWKYFLLSSVGGFKARHKQLWQIVLSKGGVQPRYERVT